MVLTLIIVASFLSYAFMAGVTYHVASKRFVGSYNEEGRPIAALLWPGYLPAAFAVEVAKRMDPGVRAERRRERELEAAEHRERLARLAEQEAYHVNRAIAEAHRDVIADEARRLARARLSPKSKELKSKEAPF